MLLSEKITWERDGTKATSFSGFSHLMRSKNDSRKNKFPFGACGFAGKSRVKDIKDVHIERESYRTRKE